ncbi:MAG: hypothetical protein D6805_07350 [Planctomycetota bacterium]|nr:MAG: hypothetical protein D6805_07350 [Planctomycetota bacterium]
MIYNPPPAHASPLSHSAKFSSLSYRHFPHPPQIQICQMKLPLPSARYSLRRAFSYTHPLDGGAEI